MRFRTRRASARLLVAIITIAALPAIAADTAPLSLNEAETLALEAQPILESQQAVVRAARERAIADRQLPDPLLITGLKDFPVNGDPAFSVSKNDFTMLTLGLRQSFPLAEKRRLMGAHGELDARAGEFELATLGREIRRDAALLWLDVFHAEQALVAARALVDEYAAQQRLIAIELRTSRARQADLLAARTELALAQDRVRSLERDSERARAQLRRYVGSEALRPLPDTLPELPQPPPLEEVLVRLREHPHVGSYAAQVRVAENEVEQAKQDYRPDWAVGIDYGYRERFPDYVGVQFEIGLPLFTTQRQDRRLAARLAAAEGMRARQENVLRQHEADARSAYADWQAARDRSRAFAEYILPQSRDRVAATELAYRSANGSLAEVLSARRACVETGLLLLEQRVDAARAQTQIRYFTE